MCIVTRASTCVTTRASTCVATRASTCVATRASSNCLLLCASTCSKARASTCVVTRASTCVITRASLLFKNMHPGDVNLILILNLIPILIHRGVGGGGAGIRMHPRAGGACFAEIHSSGRLKTSCYATT